MGDFQNNSSNLASDVEDETCAITHEKQCQQHNQTMPLLTEERMRRKLQFFFMNPIEKWNVRRRFPYKFSVQVIKIFLVTLQLYLFAYNRYNHVNYTWDNRITFSHLFLKDWDATREINAYPPAVGPFAIYKINDFFETIDYAWKGYANISEAIGPYSYPNEDNTMGPMTLCLYQYKQGTIFGFNESYIFDSVIVEECWNISVKPENGPLESRSFFEPISFNFSALVKATLSFTVKTVSFKTVGPKTAPNCYEFDIEILFENEDHDGQMLLSLDAEPRRLKCKGDIEYVGSDKLDAALRTLLNIIVMIICSLSLVLCSRALWRAHQLKIITIIFFKENFNKDLNSEDRMEFVNYWYVMIIVNDVFIIMGSFLKELIERREFTSDQWNVCSVFLGIGNLLVWFGVLRYFNFFKTYNIVILTLRKATPQVAKFLLCAMLIYAGFVFCGWSILGPYHFKFRTLSTTAECLFSLINGDDMFATFSIISNKSQMIWWFSRVYLYSFISLYIYVILNLFITVINDAYETIKLYYKEGFPKSDLKTFVDHVDFDQFSSGVYRSNSDSSLGGLMKDLCCCKRLQKSYSSLCESTINSRSTSQSEAAIPV